MFLVNTGADVSVLPNSASSRDMRSTTTKLYAANGSTIKTIGEKSINLDLGLRRDFPWSFITADVTTPIIGADFVRFYELLIDLRRNQLIENLTKLRSLLTAPTFSKVTQIKMFNANDPFADLLREFADITKLAPCGSSTKSTSGQPVFSRPRRLSPDMLTAARNEFNFLISLAYVVRLAATGQARCTWCGKATEPGDHAAIIVRLMPKLYPTDIRCHIYRILQATTISIVLFTKCRSTTML
ncbi:PREDICTED: uncharacterized protein LOC108367063 [Rhagoletis zephyria]|uniref:uncharacterized protein LOC108367063 n=1 Tax=Rhagoletis zephyria TaxID=28612 RepID=UPI0008115C65|nr:PREDICTED: uncharacterized protein LOC108367063 [Rhagoletis zephyria]